MNEWVLSRGLPNGEIGYDYSDPETGQQVAVFDLARPDGLQPSLSAPVAVLFDEPVEVLSLASLAGFRCFTSIADFRTYVEKEILHEDAPPAGSIVPAAELADLHEVRPW